MKKRIFIFSLVFLILIILMTFPLFLKFGNYLPAFFSTDESFTVPWDSWRIKNSLQNNLPFTYTNFIAYPFGANLYDSGFISYTWIGILYSLSILTNPIFTYNIQVVCNLFLSGLFTFILVFTLTRNGSSAILSSIIFAFCPYQFARSWQHLGLTYNELLPMILFTSFMLKESEAKKTHLLFLSSVLFAFSTDWTIMFLCAFILLCYMLFILRTAVISSHKHRGQYNAVTEYRFILKLLSIWFFGLIILSPQFFPILIKRFTLSYNTLPSAFNAYHRPFEDLFIQSARPLSYLLPAAVHPIFGKFTELFVGSALYGISFTEHTLYLGLTPLILAFVAVRKWKKARKLEMESGNTKIEDKNNFYIGFFVFLAIAAWFFSQPPWWKFGPIKIFMPSFFMYKLLPMFRAYCRFGIVVMLTVAVLAGFGLKFILERFKSKKTRIGVTVLFCALVLFEFWNYPPFKVIDVSKVPAAYYWLKEQPGDFAVAEYPLDANSPNEMYKFYQTKHEKKIINGTIPGTYANKVTQIITKLSDMNTAAELKWMEVKYVLVHKQDYLDKGLTEDIAELNNIPENKGLKFVRSFPSQECPQENIMCMQKTGPIDVYEVIAIPQEPKFNN